ncbi:DUF501 domain-containing protein [Enteractinococcus coprophilus]|uniref:Exopolyphosphatase/guanosine-5'-triphosphate, 3'-diphosphate pyrophosphatase n=1 Tax=Enteractinococcus coprophilus TaxID=1027633 RepID=A0A543AFH6_9MICC|nr:DUF501 domain-containing protein [Enteractinococcus coprophilus]TQL71324.1 exopolyphosphatase/guanosine-5'-triphosphate,3'-diphosphate pyrophosphatase [Enteractinococcus coprophilus]
MTNQHQPTADDLDTLSRQLGRPVRDVVEIGARCVCGNPLVATTAPRLSNGIPFPTTFYLTHPHATAAASRLENAGVMEDMTKRLTEDPELAAAYRRAHEQYLSARARIGEISAVGPVPEIDGVTAGGMPERVKCIHVLVGHSLAEGPGVNPLGDEALALMRHDFDPAVCRCEGAWDTEGEAPQKDLSRHTRRLRRAGRTNPIQYEESGTGPVAAIDAGTNSVRLLIATMTDEGMQELHREMRIVRLGQGVDETGEFAPEALERTFAAVHDYAKEITRRGAYPTRFIATSASRDVSNRDAFVTGIRQRLHVTPEVVSGEVEAELTFSGAVSALDTSRWDRPVQVAVIDLGGGSTEIVVGTIDPADGTATIMAQTSLNVGCVRFHERHQLADPPTEQQIRAAQDDLAQHLAELDPAVFDFTQLDAVVGVAGTITTITAAALGLQAYDSEAIHSTELEIDRIVETAHTLIDETTEQRAAHGFMHEGRIDVIGAGAIIWAQLLEHIREATNGRVTTAITSEKDILDGIALSLLR